MRLLQRIFQRVAVAAGEQGVAEGLGWGSAKAGVFFAGIDPLHGVKCRFTGFLFDFLTNLLLTDVSQESSLSAKAS